MLKSLGASKEDRVHLNWRVYRQSNRFYFESFYKFAIVRNPYERLVSVYTYLLGGGSHYRDGAIAKYLNENSISFEQFVMEFLSPSRIQLMELLKVQASFICDEFGGVMVDDVFRLENIEDSYSVISSRLGLNAILSFHENKSQKEPIEIYYNKEVEEKVYELYSLDFEIFDYSRMTT